MQNSLDELFEVIKSRKLNPMEGSYTCYLFQQGIDKILKKLGEETAETVIAAKNKDPDEIKNEICDLIYHLLVMMAELDIELDEIAEILKQRRLKIGNLKKLKNTDKNT